MGFFDLHPQYRESVKEQPKVEDKVDLYPSCNKMDGGECQFCGKIASDVWLGICDSCLDRPYNETLS